MKFILLTLFSLLSTLCFPQKYILIDKKMALPITYADNITVEQHYKGFFPVEKNQIKKFLEEIDKISKYLADKKNLPDAFNFAVGSTTFHGLKVSLTAEDRLDVVLTTDCGNSKISMHLSDAKNSNASNAFYINTWVKYIRSFVK